ncbi:transcription factor SOX-9-like isoform X1 [Mustela erminea]|uniref:transcription factor SOX-9-like isoform X1 n=1 Tax=Mustela erminea TaxID=36723 RepID=UPI001386AA7E|nr:transcription factor SOX-9-like isoform X1 [Mustela erminea]
MNQNTIAKSHFSSQMPRKSARTAYTHGTGETVRAADGRGKSDSTGLWARSPPPPTPLSPRAGPACSRPPRPAAARPIRCGRADPGLPAGPPTATPAGLPGEARPSHLHSALPSHLHITLEHPKGSLPRVGGPQQLTDFRPLGADAENCSWTR